MTKGVRLDTEMVDRDGHEWIVTGGGIVLRDRGRVPMAELRALPIDSDVRRFLRRHGVSMKAPVKRVLVGVTLSQRAIAKLAKLRVAWDMSPSQVVERLLVETPTPPPKRPKTK